MKFDMHCHTKAGSIDSRVSIDSFIDILKSKDFDGLLITDHDSYKGYKTYIKNKSNISDDNFVVLKGIEYDTKDAGHFIAIMPNNVSLPVLQIRGMSVEILTRIVHHYGGILGPAHPFGVRSSSAMFFNKMKSNPELLYHFDFIEGFNTCESEKSNRVAQLIAERYNKPCIGGSDSHEEKYVGMAYTEIDYDIKSNDDLIMAIKENKISSFGGTERGYTKKNKYKNAFYSVWGFRVYNRGLGFIFTPFRSHQIKRLSIDWN